MSLTLLHTNLPWIAFFLSGACGLMYCVRYAKYPRPPNDDIVSPLVLLFMALGIIASVPWSFTMFLGLTSLILDAIADFTMNVEDLGVPIVLFSVGHLFRQFAFIFEYYPNGSFIILEITMVLIVFLMFAHSKPPWSKWCILAYAGVIGLTLINVSLISCSVNVGLVLFVISDLIIVYELAWTQIKHRQLRVILVPVLFWAAEATLMYKLLS